MYQIRTRVISMLLSVILLFNLTTPALAVMQDQKQAPSMILTDKDGNPIENSQSWEEEFPYGTFAFESSQLATKEGSAAQTIKVYRLGGTKGKAQLTLSLSPVVTQLDDGAYSFATAAGVNDYVIEVEDMLPIAAYQPFGFEMLPQAPAEPVAVVAESATENTVDEAGEPVWGNTILRADIEADSYQWQGLTASGAWVDLDDCTDQTLDVSNEALEVSDFRCVYAADGVLFCTDSFGGIPYVEEQNEAIDIPEDLDRNPAQSFHTLDLSEGEFDTYEFYMTFAEGEWVKEIRITPINDEISENVELFTLTIDACKGGELYDTANTLLVSIEDNDEVLPSFFSLETTSLTVDKASGSALLTVKRTGALQYVATVDYHTVDGTARAGVDYADTSGTLYFASDMEEAVIEIPLINDGVAVPPEQADKTFSVVLEHPTGGGPDTAITGSGQAVVSLYNTGETIDPNLATMLYTPEADDVSGSVQTTAGAIAPGVNETVVAEPAQALEEAPVEVVFGTPEGEDDEVQLLQYDASAYLNLKRSNLPTSLYWDNYADLGGMESWSATNNTQKLAYQGWDDNNQVSLQSDGYFGRRVEDIDGGNDRFSRWNYQKISQFDQLFTRAQGQYRADTDYNWLGTFWSTAWGGIANQYFGSGNKNNWAEGDGISDTSRSVNLVRIVGHEAGWIKNYSYWFNVKKGDQGMFISLGIEDKGGADTGSPNGEVYQKARGERRYLNSPLKYYVHTADDNTLTANQKTALYSNIAPKVSVVQGKGGVTSAGKVYVGTEFSLSKPLWSSYAYANNTAVFLSKAGDTANRYNSGSVASNGTASLQLMGGGSNSFASGGNLDVNTQYAVNVILNRRQNIKIDISPSVPRAQGGQSIDPGKIGSASDTFWSRATIRVNGAQNKSGVTFTPTTTTATKNNFSSVDSSATISSSTTFDNIRSINFGLPKEDQILFNGVQYNGNEDIPIPISMFGMNTLAFTYYHEDYVSVESDMKLIITRVEHYVDLNGNGQLDGTLNRENNFDLKEVNGVKDVLVRTMDAEEYAITEFWPLVDENGKTVQQFLKFYYNMTPRCLTVPVRDDASEDDRAQILPAFVTSVTDASQKAALSTEMQGYRFITSGKHSHGYPIYDNAGNKVGDKVAGTYSGDDKFMYTAKANATESVDFALGGDFSPIAPTYVYQKQGSQTKTSHEAPSVFLEKSENEGYALSDITYRREDWKPDYHGNLLYEFQDPTAIFVSDSLVGENLPVAPLVEAGNNANGGKDKYDVSALNGYLGSFNPLDTVSLCIRPQTMKTDEIHSAFDVDAQAVSTFDAIQSGEHTIEVDSSNAAGFKTVPDASGLRRTTAGDKDVEQGADTSASSNSMPEFNVDLGVELPSLSVGLTDFVTLITDGSEFGFSIGIPVFKAEKSKSAYTTSDELYGSTKPAYGKTETSFSESVGNLKKVKDAFANPGKLINSEEWKAAKNAKAKALDSDKLVKSKGFEFSVAFNVTVMFKYSPTDNTYHFSSAMVFLQFGFQFKVTARLTVCPIVYAYFVVGASLELAGGVINEREVVENTNALIDVNDADDILGMGVSNSDYTSGKALRIAPNLTKGGNASSWSDEPDDTARGKALLKGDKGDAFTFVSKSDAVNLYFSGKVKVELKTGEDWNNLGYVASDGKSPVLVMFDEKVDGVADQEVRITVLDEAASFDTIAPISSVRNETFFSGLSLTPAIFLEVGAGIGVEVLKVEIYLKASIGCSMAFATRENNAATKGSQLRDPSSSSLSLMGASASVTSLDDSVSALGDDKVTPFSFNSMTFRAGFGVRVVLILFNFELDVVQFGIDYSKEQVGKGEDGFKKNGWKFAWYVLNGGETIKSYDLSGVDDSDGFPGIKITLPSNTFTAQQIFGPENAKMVVDEISAFAFDPENLDDNEFQISGYSSSRDAFRLATGLATGTDYELLTVGQDNYLLYTISRENPQNPVDSNMLVLSKIQNTGENVGLAHPATGSTESGKNYLAVDDDDTGDLDFSGNATGDTIHVSWVSYETETPAAGDAGGAATMPTQARPFYESGLFKVYMDKDNYEDEKFTPKEPSKPAPVVEEPADSLPDPAPTEPSGDEVTTMPDEADYYVTAEVYDTLDEDGKAKYSATSETGDETNYHVAIGYNNYNEAKAVYDEKAELYEQWQSWREYEALKGQWDKYNDYISSDAYQQYEADYQQYEDDLSIYEDWFNYFNGEREAADTAQSQLAASAKNTVVKTAFFQVVPADQMSDDNASTFSEPKVIGANSEDADGSDGYKFLPAVSADGKLTFYARTNNYSEEEKQAATARAQEFYKASRGDVSTDSEGVSSGEGDPTAAFRYAYSTSMDDVYGKNTAFLFSYTKDDGTVVTTGFTPTGWDQGPGTRLSSASMVMLDDSTFYLAYTATQTQTVVDDDSYGDMSVHKLYLQMGTIDAETGEVSLEPAKMLRQLVDVNDYGHGVNSALVTGLNGVVTGQDINQPYDGVYVNRDNSGATMLDHFEDPYFGVVRFLRGDLGSLSGEEENFAESLQFKALDASSSLFMLFEMNGTTYVVPESSLKTITATEGDKAGKGMIIPFFTPSEDNRTRGNMSIGADGEGRIAAVYTDTMPNTTNNALFVSTYDPATASFGEGRMLAMNYMQVYEDSIAAGWSPQDTEQAYYGKLAGYNATEDDPSGKPGNKQGGMTSFTFSNLAVALGLKKTVEPATVSSLSGGTEPQNGKRERPVVAFNAGEPPKAIENSTLVILTQGTRTELTQTPFLGDGSSTLIVPKTNDDGSIVSSTGFYALSFGVGTKNVGEASITFEEPTFVPGAQLRPIVSFKNTGDVPLSASPTQPMTVELWISAQPETGEEGVTYGTGEHLFTWKITQNIAVGQSVSTTLDVKDGSIISTDSYTAKLPTDLEGRKFYFTVREFAGEEGSDAPAIDNPFNYSSMADEKGVTRTIEAKPELAIENLVFKTLGVDETGDNVRVAVSMDVTNRGTKDAVAPYLQFAYQTGRTMEEVSPGDTDYQKAVYGALDLTGSNFTVNRQEIISALSGDSDASRGVLRLIDKDGNSNIDQNHKRFVEGELLISKDAYCEATATGSLNLKVTVFEEGDVITALSSTGLQTSNFDNEYSGSNNVGFKELEPMSFFTAPTKITLPMNTALRISLPVTTTTKQPPVITVSELNIQAVETQEKRLGILYYDMGASGTGKDGYLVLQPTAQGSGIIRVSDVNTASSVDIAFTVDEKGSGLNIFRDNEIFTWYDANGRRINLDTDSFGAFWTFQESVADWGHVGGVADQIIEVPYRGDLAKANQSGVSFSFTTLAETIDLYFDGTVRVTSDVSKFNPISLTASGGNGTSGYRTINLGENPKNEARTVTVTVTSDHALFDKMVQTFSKNQDILPDTGGAAPLIYFSRILPEVGSLKSSDYPDGFPLTVYIVDETGLTPPTLTPGSANAASQNFISHNDAFCQFDVLVKQNGTFSISASDTAGNTSTRNINVGWFSASDEPTTTDTPVALEVELRYRDASGAFIEPGNLLKKDQYAFADVNAAEGAKVSVQYYSVTTSTITTSYALVEESAGVWKLKKTVTRTNAAGSTIGDPVITTTDATATTPVPDTSVATETKGEWVDVSASTEDLTLGLYPVINNAVYKVTASINGGGSSTRLFLMDRLNTDLPSIDLTTVTAADAAEQNGISYLVRKGVTGQANIREITVNGYRIFNHTSGNNAAPTAVSNLYPINYGGNYQFVATDYAGNAQSSTTSVTLPIVGGDGWVTVEPSYSQARNNGRVLIDKDKLTGGLYDAELSTPTANSYGNAYQFALTDQSAPLAPDTADLSPEQAAQSMAAYLLAFDAFVDALPWQDATAFEGLTPGDYTLYVRDKEHTPESAEPDNYLTTTLSIDDTAVAFTAQAQRRNEFGLRVITVTATGGGSQEYEFFLMPRENSTDILDATGIQEAIDANPSLAWTTEGDSVYRFFNCDYGWNQVAVRDKDNPDNLYTELVQMRRASGPPPEITPVEQDALTKQEQQEIIRKNQTQDVVVENDDCVVIIPAGTLKDGDSVSDLLISLDDALGQPAGSNVVQRTDADGQTRILPWCALSDGRMFYVADQVGKYDLIHNPKSFDDVTDHWAADYVAFTAARELFQGTSDALFSPDTPMTRGMFVTVLGRMQGIDQSDYDEAVFDDVAQDAWFAPYVQWASENGIVSGYGNNLFGPDDPITREQMAVILFNYARFAQYDTSTSGELDAFPDHTSISSWAQTQTAWAVGCELLSGRPDGSLDPAGRATRAEVSAILQRFIAHVLLSHPALKDLEA